MFNITEIHNRKTPFYYYDMELLRATLRHITDAAAGRPLHIHYAIKANSNPVILKEVAGFGLGADCVSGAEIEAAIAAGFAPQNIFFAGVGKSDDEILTGLRLGIGCFNVESIEELAVINELALSINKTATIALRINPNIDAHTHHYITTGLEENKFGIDMRMLDTALDTVAASPALKLEGLHFHIGSQITTVEPFTVLCDRINGLVDHCCQRGFNLSIINVGGGLGIDYDNPDATPVPDFSEFFNVVTSGLHLTPGQTIHCEPGRAIVAQCGTLISRVLYVKNGMDRKFVILDAGMTELIRPALYEAHHVIQNLTPTDANTTEKYDVVGPVCESSDTFAVNEELPVTRRGDIFAIRSAGAYGETMASHYNLRSLNEPLFV